ncbi:MAG: cytidine deaminase [Defluviitaleaceae bacterium]|nr:cytidine deaminase [Defluviitaleaceae bacterium]
MHDRNLIELASLSRNFSYAPYSTFKVGTALLASNGKVYTGCNIESASYTPTNCAERTAFFKAISEGVTTFEAIAIVGGFDDAQTDCCYPCGVCLQVMAEFCEPDFKIILVDRDEHLNVYRLDALLPYRFGPTHLKLKGVSSE